MTSGHLVGGSDESESRDIKKRRRKTITLSTISSIVGVLAVVSGGGVATWDKVIKPTLIDAVAIAAAADLDDKVAAAVKVQVAPVEAKVNAGNAGLKAIILGNITGLEDDISKLEFIRDQPPPNDFTDEHRRQLLSKQRSLRVQKKAFDDIIAAELVNVRNTREQK